MGGERIEGALTEVEEEGGVVVGEVRNPMAADLSDRISELSPSARAVVVRCSK